MNNSLKKIELCKIGLGTLMLFTLCIPNNSVLGQYVLPSNEIQMSQSAFQQDFTTPSDDEIKQQYWKDYMAANTADPYAYIFRDTVVITVNSREIQDNWLIVHFSLSEDFFEDHIMICVLQDQWQLVSEFTPGYNELIQQVPVGLLSIEEKTKYTYPFEVPDLSQQASIYTYEFPWQGGIAHKITNILGHGHYAYDFSMNTGTEIWAATGGRVVGVKEDTAASCYVPGTDCTQACLDSGNYIKVFNTDGRYTLYVHIKQNGAVVNVGDTVSTGDLIGYSGNTGCSSGPHLHFDSRYSGTYYQVYFNPYGNVSAGTTYTSNNYRSQPTCPATTSTQAYVCTPSLTPTYANNSCSTYWYPFTGFNGNPAYLTENAQSSATSSNYGRWTPNLQTAGTYKVEAYVAHHDPFNVTCSWGTATLNADTSNAKYVVHSTSGDTTVVRDQLPLSNQWLDLGQFNFNAGSGGYVTLSDLTGETRNSTNPSFSAMRFTLVNNPAPTLSSISPNTTTAGGSDFALTVTGSNFINGSVVRWNGSDRPTNFVSTSQLIASISASDIDSGESASVTVFTPAPGGGTSGAKTFTITYPDVSITSISPTAKAVGEGGFTLTVNGSNFMNGATVKWNGSTRPTTFINSTQLTASITAADISVIGNYEITVTNPSPSNKTSNGVSFQVSNHMPVLSSLGSNRILAGSSGFTLVVNGSNFIDGAVVTWNGSELTTNFVSSSRLDAQVPTSYLADIGEINISVSNPAPSAGTSNEQSFYVHTFDDVLPSVWHWRWVEGFYAQGITTGCAASPLRYCPDRAVTRAEMAVFILRAKNGTATPVPTTTDLFADVPVAGKAWMQPWIEQFYNEGITTGCAAGPLKYCPERQVTRAEMAVFILRAIHGPDYVPPAATGVFSDVPVAGKEWMQPWIEQFYREGITTGCASSPLRYCPEQSVTRAEMATFIDRAFGYPQLP